MENAVATRQGRPYIGPKAQTHIPQEEMDWILEETRRRQVLYADMLREVVSAGIAALRGEE